ncbi:MAG: hypothetical protein WA761_04685 [Thermoplasmata archaeon]
MAGQRSEDEPRAVGADGDVPSRAKYRVHAIMTVARHHGVEMPSEQLRRWLPAEATPSEEELNGWIREWRSSRSVSGGVPPGADTRPDDGRTAERRERGSRYLERAHQIVLGPLAPALPLTMSIGVTGSSAYGEPEAGDDLDFMVITKDGALWVFLLMTFVRLRLVRPMAGSGPGPAPCFNYLMEDAAAREEFGRPRGFLFAREALTTRAITGGSYYRGLLKGSRWLEMEVPGAWEEYTASEGMGPSKVRVPSAIRAINGVLFPVVAAFQQAKSLFRNHQLRRSGRTEECFRTVTLWSRFALLTEKFDRHSRVFSEAGWEWTDDGEMRDGARPTMRLQATNLRGGAQTNGGEQET